MIAVPKTCNSKESDFFVIRDVKAEQKAVPLSLNKFLNGTLKSLELGRHKLGSPWSLTHYLYLNADRKTLDQNLAASLKTSVFFLGKDKGLSAFSIISAPVSCHKNLRIAGDLLVMDNHSVEEK